MMTSALVKNDKNLFVDSSLPLEPSPSRVVSATPPPANIVALAASNTECSSNATLWYFIRALNRYEPGLVHLVLIHLATVRTQIDNDAMPEICIELRKSAASELFELLLTRRLRWALCVEQNPPIEAAINSGAVPACMRLLRSRRRPHELQVEALWVLTNISCGTHDQTATVVGQGPQPDGGAAAILPVLRTIMQPGQSIPVLEQAVWLIGNIAGDGHAFRDLILEADLLPLMLMLLGNALHNSTRTRTPTPTRTPTTSTSAAHTRTGNATGNADGGAPPIKLIRTTIWALSNLCRGRPFPSMSHVAPILPVVAQYLDSVDEITRIDCCWCISYLSDGGSDRIARVLDAGVAPLLVQMVQGAVTDAELTPALRALGNIVTGDSDQTQAVLECDGFTETMVSLLHLLSPPPPLLEEEEEDEEDAADDVDVDGGNLAAEEAKGCLLFVKSPGAAAAQAVGRTALQQHRGTDLDGEAATAILASSASTAVVDSGAYAAAAAAAAAGGPVDDAANDSNSNGGGIDVSIIYDNIIGTGEGHGRAVAGDFGGSGVGADPDELPFVPPEDLQSRERLRKEICWLLSNIAADSHAQIETLLSTDGLVEAVCQVLTDGADKSKREAVWVLANIAENGTVRQAGMLISGGAIAPLCAALQLENSRSCALACGALSALLDKSPAPSVPMRELRGRNPSALAVEAAGGVAQLRRAAERDDLQPNLAAEMLSAYFA